MIKIAVPLLFLFIFWGMMNCPAQISPITNMDNQNLPVLNDDLLIMNQLISGLRGAINNTIWTLANGVIYPTAMTNNVGIGSATAGQRLDVQGTVKAQAFIANNASAVNTFAGNVGIGSILPNYALNVLGNVGIGTQNAIYSGSTLMIYQDEPFYHNLYIDGAGVTTPSWGVGDDIGIGYGALSSVTNNNGYNVAVGVSSQHDLTTGSGNVSFGTGSLAFNETGTDNTAVGHNALAMSQGQVGGSNNSAFGSLAGSGDYDGTKNTYLGKAANFSNHGGTGNVIIGASSFPLDNSTSNEVVMGGYAGSAGSGGHGTNTVTIGNSFTANNFFNGNIGIGTTATPVLTGGKLIMTDSNNKWWKCGPDTSGNFVCI